MDFRTVFTDVLVIGGGVAGLRAAMAAADKGVKVTMVSKGGCASPEIMGLNAPVMPGDSADLYFADIEKSGYGINDSRLGRLLADRISGEVEWLENNGVHFAKDEGGAYLPIHTLGTAYPRLIRSGTSTGSDIMRQLNDRCKERGIVNERPIDVLGLLQAGRKVIGAYGLDGKTGSLVRYVAKSTVLATGGCGAMQSFSTYPRALVGDGYAMAYEAGATLVDMEFQQFEPCCFVYPPEISGKVIATTLLRHGAELLNGEGHEFMPDYGLTRSNAQKGSLARAMLAEVRAGRGTPHGGIYYNMTMLSPELLYVDHEIFTKPAVNAGIDLTKQMPEMMPAAHTNIGGVVIGADGFVGIDGLYACGEVIGGLHGGNRLGGCAGAETVVFGHIAGDGAADHAAGAEAADAEQIDGAWNKVCAHLDELMRRSGDATPADIRKTLGLCLTENLGISRNADTIAKAMAEVGELERKLGSVTAADLKSAAEAVHCEHMLLLAMMQIKASDMRTESRGVYFREDHPETDEQNWRKNILIRKAENGMELSVRDAIGDTSF